MKVCISLIIAEKLKASPLKTESSLNKLPNLLVFPAPGPADGGVPAMARLTHWHVDISLDPPAPNSGANWPAQSRKVAPSPPHGEGRVLFSFSLLLPAPG